MRFTATLTGGSIPMPDEHWSIGEVHDTPPRVFDSRDRWREYALAEAKATHDIVRGLLEQWVSELEPILVYRQIEVGGSYRIVGLAGPGQDKPCIAVPGYDWGGNCFYD